jgi:hypothetical protein
VLSENTSSQWNIGQHRLFTRRTETSSRFFGESSGVVNTTLFGNNDANWAVGTVQITSLQYG